VTVGGQKVNCKADFASDHVTFSGGRRGEVPYTKVQVLGTAKGILKLRVDGALMEFPLGSKVDRVAAKVRKPPTLMEKLGVKPGLSVATVNVDAKAFTIELEKVAPNAIRGEPGRPVDLLFLGVRGRDELERIAATAHHFKPDGGMWVVYPKGRRDLRESDVLAAGREAGLKDIKVARVSTSLTALKFVVPVAARPAASDDGEAEESDD
ncbi:MAG: hypothetical protein QOJ26_416, partial [Thermoplasmata archaeon]|nr:hypothetical protein [Thermoplasmata archaeon]